MTTDIITKAAAKAKATIKTIKVDVRATENEDGTVQFDSVWRHTGGKPGVWKSGRIDLPHGPEHYEVTFDLDDKSGKNLKFYGVGAGTTPDQPDLAMYCQVDGTCPPAMGNADGEIDYIDVDPGKLTVMNFNHKACILKYMLRFDGDAFVTPDGKSYPPYEYDPDFRNGGGGSN